MFKKNMHLFISILLKDPIEEVIRKNGIKTKFDLNLDLKLFPAEALKLNV